MAATTPTSESDPEVAAESVEDKREEIKKPIFRDIRRYYCEYCGICRSKKSLIRSHVLTNHKDEVEKSEAGKIDSESEVGEKEQYTCEECGASFRKPAYLKQHMQGHSFETAAATVEERWLLAMEDDYGCLSAFIGISSVENHCLYLANRTALEMLCDRGCGIPITDILADFITSGVGGFPHC